MLSLIELLTEAHRSLNEGNGDEAWAIVNRYESERHAGGIEPTIRLQAFGEAVSVPGDEYANAVKSNVRLDSSDRWAVVTADIVS